MAVRWPKCATMIEGDTMPRSRRQDDWDDEHDDEEQVTRIKGGFGFGFLGTMGCVFALFLMFCVLPIGFFATGGCMVKNAVEKVREREQQAAQKGE